MIRYKPPEEFCSEAKKYMNSLVKLLNKDGIVCKLDTVALELMGNSYNTYLLAQEILLQEGLCRRGKDGNVIGAHPMVRVSHDSWVELTKLLLEFNMTPRRRHKKPTKEPASPMEQFLKGKKMEVR